MSTDDVRAMREQLVDHLLDAGRITTAPVAEAFRGVPRHLFLPGVAPTTAYTDEAIPTKWGPDGRAISSSSQPSIMAIMLEQLSVEPGHRVLEIGAGTGYNAALLAHLVGESGAVTTVDIDQDLVDRARDHLAAGGFTSVQVVCADGAGGYAEGAPYDRIILTVGADEVAPAWVDQLSPVGRLVLPLSVEEGQRSVALEWHGGQLVTMSSVGCGFMPLRGSLAESGTACRLAAGQ